MATELTGAVNVTMPYDFGDDNDPVVTLSEDDYAVYLAARMKGATRNQALDAVAGAL